MYVDKKPRHDRNGKPYFSILYREDSGKLHRLPKDKHPHFASLEDAEAWIRSQEGIRSAKAQEIIRKTAWKTQYYDFAEMLKKYTVYQKERAPNSWRSSVQYLEQWVFTFFLQVKQSSNVNDWHLFFEEFRLWLGQSEAMVLKGRRQPLAVNSKNNIVKALNTFLKCLGKLNLMDRAVVRECEAWPESSTNQRGVEAVIEPDEMRRVFEKLKTINIAAAEFYLVMWHTGMRFSELFGLPFVWLYRGKPKEGKLTSALERHKIEYFGYLVLESQPYHDDRWREDGTSDEDGYVGEIGSIRRKPLKSTKRIDPKYYRTIPIRTTEVWNILAKRHKVQSQAFLERRYTANKKDYPLFGDLEWNEFYNAYKRAYTSLKLPFKELHSCRHTFCTMLTGETNDFALVRMITGHRSSRVFERYNHLFDQLALEAKQNDQEIEEIPEHPVA